MAEGSVVLVRVIKPFAADRTPCPPTGTIGEWYDVNNDGFYCVRFPLPMVDTEGIEWLSQGGCDDFMRLRFRIGEIELVEEAEG